MKTTLILSLSSLFVGSISAQLVNGGFETGDLTGWFSSPTAAVDASEARSGLYSVGLPLVEPDDALVFQFMPASPGEVWDFSGFGKVLEPITENDFALLKIVWRDLGGNDLPPIDILVGSADIPSFPGIRSDVVFDAGNQPIDWTGLTARGVAPAGTAEVAFFALAITSGGTSPSTVYFDDLVATRLAVPEPAVASLAGLVLVAGALVGRRRRRAGS